MKKSKILIVANWKMNPDTYAKADKLFQESLQVSRVVKSVKVILCIPYTWLTDFSHKPTKVVSFGAQDASFDSNHSQTGEVSPAMLRNSGVDYVILGHSERRALGETDTLIAQKVLLALKTGLKVILCVGEKERDEHGEYLHFLRNQIFNSLNKLSKRFLKNLIIAYEPIWAIGKSEKEAMKPEDLHETSLFIKKVLAEIYGAQLAITIPILYGGSVNAQNAKALITSGEVAGLLVGHESLDAKKFGDLLLAVDC
jgi:triosephosphate isomerase